MEAVFNLLQTRPREDEVDLVVAATILVGDGTITTVATMVVVAAGAVPEANQSKEDGQTILLFVAKSARSPIMKLMSVGINSMRIISPSSLDQPPQAMEWTQIGTWTLVLLIM